ncbi:uncharacterized protein LOC113771486 [Coffea eugenioides]|uniref:F-box/FBD/LRR-repeat protein At3g23955 n=1 Tax=Coffea arabica TaxID=13443 RepID=A0A6P6S3N0_COFAR|nr:uncharacterized protein LOC113687342 [Coffea arabica]XP_027171863.1 uncharacterized protein LOC113771486 [Coffea eugenioides]
MDQKRSRSKELLTGKKDRISQLPESILSHILSRLPTEDAVRTSGLSRKWEYKWTSIYNLTFDDGKRFRYSPRRRKWKRQKQPKKTDFMNFVDRVLALSKNSSIKECHLLFLDVYDPFRMKTWITAALGADVQRLFISYAGVLKDDPSSPLFLTFPVIEEFLSSDCKWRNVKMLKIEALRLASQSKLVDASLQYWKPDMNDDIKQRSKTGFQACMILTRFSAFIRFLELSTDLIQVLADANPRCPPNFFYKLAHLKVYSASIAIQCDAALINFMKMAPGLESLTFTGEFSRQAADDYDQIQLLPGYLSFLEVVKLKYSYSPKPTESTLVKFILRNAAQLKELLICSQHEGHKVDEVRDHLFKCSRDLRIVSILSL